MDSSRGKSIQSAFLYADLGPLKERIFFSTNALEAGFDQTAIKVIHYSLIHENQENYTICGGPLYYD